MFVTFIYIKKKIKNHIKKYIMQTTQLDNGILNNYAFEPKVTYAEYPAVYEQRRYLQQAAIATLLVTATIFIAFAVS